MASATLSALLGCAQPSSSTLARAQGTAYEAPKISAQPSELRPWHTVLAELHSQSSEASSCPGNAAEHVAKLLREALLSVRADNQWNCSGIAELLQRALDMSERGCVHSARKAAVGLLDFHKMVEKYRQVVASRTRSSSSSGKRHSSEDIDSADVSEDACGPLLKRQRSNGTDDTSADETGPLRAEFAVPHLPARKASTAHKTALPAKSSSCSSGPTAVWTGPVWQSGPNDRELVYCKVSVPLPAEVASELEEAQSMEVVQLAPRRAVKLGRHRVCKCTIVDASPAQLSKLRSMAQNELVALAPLEKHGLILVPYVASGQVRLVAFCLF